MATLAGSSGGAWDMTTWGSEPKGKVIPLPATPSASAQDVTINSGYGPGYGYNRIYSLPFDGEKDFGEMGPIRQYIVDHAALRLRGWQLYLESDVCQALFCRSAIWAMGTGLRLQCKPSKEILKSKGINIESESFNKSIEELFKIYSGNTLSDYSGLRDLHEMANEAWINSRVGGDVIVVMRLSNGMPKVELIDGSQLRTPVIGETNATLETINPDNKNVIRNGIEQDKSGRHIAYWINKRADNLGIDDFERIPVRLEKYPYSQMATIVYGLKYRLANNRGIPLITAVMETAAKMGRYREATLGSAEENAKVSYTIEHKAFSDGSNPVISQMAQAFGGGPQTDLPVDSFGQSLGDKVAATFNKTAFNMPLGAELKPHRAETDVNFKDFYGINFDIVCAVAGYPPEVILSKYDSNYSASRAAIKDFEHTLLVQRERFANQFYQIVYNFCLDVWALDGSIDAPGYLDMLMKRDEIGLAAYRNAFWAGDNVPHIDPEKEVRAWRLKLGNNFDDVPLCTVEEATEALSGGDADSNIEQAAKEREKATEEGFEAPEKGMEAPDDEEEDNPNPKKKKDD